MHLSTKDVCYGNKLVERFVLEVCIGVIDEATKNGMMDKLREDGYELRIALNGHEIDAESYFKSLDERLATRADANVTFLGDAMSEHKDAYFCLCCFCNNQFEGDKREVVCPECKKTHGTEQRKVKVEIIDGNKRGYYSGTVYINGIRTDLELKKGFKGDFERFQSKVNSLSNDELLELVGRALRDQSKHVEIMERALAGAQKVLKSIEKTVTTLQEEIVKEESWKA